MIRDTWSQPRGKSPVDSRQVKVDLLPHDLVYLLLIKRRGYCSIFTLCSLYSEMTDNLTSSIQDFSIKFFTKLKGGSNLNFNIVHKQIFYIWEARLSSLLSVVSEVLIISYEDMNPHSTLMKRYNDNDVMCYLL